MMPACHAGHVGSIPTRIVALWAHVHLVIVIMNAIQTIKATYNYDQCKEIVDHGCESGVCSQHIYYADTIKFFDRYENEVIHWLADQLGDDIIEEIWNRNPGHIAGYKNEIVWSFIELVASSIVDAKEEQERSDDTTIEEYIMFGGNPSRSMTDSRYAQV